MREFQGQDPLQGREASLEDIRHAFESLTEADWVKLDDYSEVRIRQIGVSASGRDACHLFMEAVNSLETARRHWRPGNVDLVKFMIDAMWSISSNWARQRRTTGYVQLSETDLILPSDEEEESESPLNRARSRDRTPEEELIWADLQTEEQLVEEIKKLFEDQLLTSLIFDGWIAGMKGPEIIEALKIDENQYRTATRLIRRRIQARWPEGMPNVR
jgi:hypothetical protein